MASLFALFAQSEPRRIIYLPFDDARPVLEALDEILPIELKGKTVLEQEALWQSWASRHDGEIRARLAQGDEDSLINFLLFGTSFTKQPRVSLEHLGKMKRKASLVQSAGTEEQPNQISRLIAERIKDLLMALAKPGGNERLLFARQSLVAQKGFRLRTSEQRKRVGEYLRSSLDRVLNENAGYARVLESARLQGNSSEEFAERSRLFRTRGLASDTSLLPNFAIEESLRVIKTRGLLEPGAVRRVAVVGPGLDFTDKQEGYDFYPQQTIQPFAIIDTLLRLELSKLDTLQVVTFDLSPRVNHHLALARQRAQRGQAYVLQLPRDLNGLWTPEAVRYWEHFGDQVGVREPPVAIPGTAGDLKVRAVRIAPSVVTRVLPVDTNIVLQRLDLPASERFDLIIATNIFVYYDTLDQSLAMMNIERMLRPGGFMLSNNALLELPFFRVRSLGYSTVVYSSRPNDGDHVVWYQRRGD
ncbi:MAG: class I SAM-dependent methyltransferase [Pyrinomonadaceae bacterium]